MISSSENSTAAIGVLKAAARAADAADGDERLQAVLAEAAAAADHRCQTGADVDRRALAAEGDAAGQRDGAAHELADDGSERDHAVGNEQRELRLRDAAAPGEGEVAEQEPSGDQRTQRWARATAATARRRRVTCGRRGAR